MPSSLDSDEPPVASEVALAVFAQVSAMSAMMILLSHWHSKSECLAVIAFSSCLATMLAYWMAPLRSSLCFWLSPLAVVYHAFLLRWLWRRPMPRWLKVTEISLVVLALIPQLLAAYIVIRVLPQMHHHVAPPPAH